MRQNAAVSLWRRLFDSDFRAARAAEAAGDLPAAAAGYAAAKAGEDLARVNRRRAAQATPSEAVGLLRAAQDADPSAVGARALAKALLAVAPHQAPDMAAASRLEAGAILERLGDDAGAAAAYEGSGAWQDAADSYAEVGDIAAVERVVAAGAAREVATLTRDGLEARILAAADGGRADRALAALEQARARLGDCKQVEAVAAALAARLLAPGWLPLGDRRLYHGAEVVVGQGGHLSAAVRGLRPDHLVLRRTADGVEARDEAGARAIDGRARLELCVGCSLAIRPVPHGWSLTLTVRGLAGVPVWWVDRCRFADGSEVIADGRWWRLGERILVRGDAVGGETVA